MRKSLTGLVAVGMALALAACGSTEETVTNGDVKANMGATIGIAMPTKTSTRWIADGNNMVDQFTDMGYKVNLQYADNNVKTQVAQVQSMIDGGDKLLVIAAIDGASMDGALASAAAKKIPVIAYDRLLTGTQNVSYQATFDNFRVGEMQAQLLIDRLGLSKKAKGPFNVELFAGSPTDANAKSFYTGAMELLQPYIDSRKIIVRSGQTTFGSISTVNYDSKIAGARMKKILAAQYTSIRVDAVLSPYDACRSASSTR